MRYIQNPRQLQYVIILLILWIENSTAQKKTKNISPEGPIEDYSDRNEDGSYTFGYKNLDSGAHFHTATASRDNTVSGRYGYRNSANHRVVQTTYTAGRRGFRARGPDIARLMDLSQAKIPYSPPVQSNSSNYQPSFETYNDPNEDPSYKFSLKTPTYSRGETADSRGTVNGAYSYIDDVGKRHDVQYEAGSETGFQVKTPFPDSDQFLGRFYRGPNKPGTPPRGHTSIVQSVNGAYRFYSAGPDQNRAEISDSLGRVRGSYTYIDDKGVQRSVQYVAGPNIGYKIIRKGSSPFYSSDYPYLDPEFSNPILDNSIPSINLLPPSTVPSLYDNNSLKPSVYDVKIPKPENKPLLDISNFLGHNDQLYLTSTFAPGISTSKKPPYDNYGPSEPFHKSHKSSKLNNNKIYNMEHVHEIQTKSYDDFIADKQSNGQDFLNHDCNKLFTSKENTFQTTNGPSKAYLYPKPSKNFDEEPNRDYSNQNYYPYSGSSKNFLRLPPGVPVKAHVQSLDILPYGSKIPPPDETLQRHLFEELQRGR